MPTTLMYPTFADLSQIEAIKLPRLMQDRLGFSIMPTKTEDADILMWEQKDYYKGLQQIRGLEGNPKRVNRVGAKRYIMTPGEYGEFIEISEREIKRRRQFGSLSQPIDIRDLVLDAQEQLLQRRLDRMETVIWKALQGSLGVPYASENGVPGGVSYSDTFPVQTYTAGVSWGTPGTSTPLADMRAVKLLGRGVSTQFGQSALGYANATTINKLLSNTNPADLGGKKGQYGASLTGLGGYNNIFSIEGLATLVEYDETYYDESGALQLFIPDNKVILIGKRANLSAIGYYCLMRNINNAGFAPGAYTAFVDRGAEGSGRQIPRRFEMHDGHSGAPQIQFPGSIVVLNV